MVFGPECQRKVVEKSSMPGEQKVGKSLPFKKPKNASFGKSNRLLLKADFSVIFRDPTGQFSANPLRMLYRKNELQSSRIGIIVPKRVIRLATERNQHKRIVKEQFRRVKECLPNVDIVLLVNRKADRGELKQSCDRIWKFLTVEIDG